MADMKKPGNGAEGKGTADLVSLEEAAQSPTAGGQERAGDKQDSMMHAANVFEVQIEQMTAWKHQLAQQMELLRRDGLKLLERQKNLAVERMRVAEEREAVTADRAFVQKLHREVEEDTKKLAGLREEMVRLEEGRHELEVKAAELGRRENELAEREAKHLQQDVVLRGAMEELEGQRKQLMEALGRAASEREELGRRRAEIEAAGQRAVEEIQRDRESAAEKMEEARAGMEQLNETRERQQQRWTALEARAAELAGAEEAVRVKAEEAAKREESLKAARREVDEAQARILAGQNELMAAERQLAERLAAAEAGKKELEGQKQEFAARRREQEKKLDTREGELAEQFEGVAKQTRRLTERRAELEEAATDFERAVAERIEGATAALREEMQQTQAGHEERVRALQEEMGRAEAGAANWKARQAELEAGLATAGAQVEGLKLELARVGRELDEASAGRTAQAKMLAEQVMRFEEESAEWQRKLERATAAGANSEPLKAAAAGAKEQAEKLAAKIEELTAAREDLASRLGAEAARAEEMERRAAETNERLGAAAREMQAELERREREMGELRRRNELLASEKQQMIVTSEDVREGQESVKQTREKLLRQARGLRAYRKQVRETKLTLASHSDEIARQREQLRARKENLEQVKRLLEKQELVMARKLADHNALKTVAAVGIFVIMILGSVFFGVYRLVSPVYRAEAMVQLAAPPGNMEGAEMQSWLTKQLATVRSNEVTAAAWKMLRAGDTNYAMHDTREEWVASLPKALSLQADAGSKTLVIRYSGPNAEGASGVCNALATAYVTPGVREGTEAKGSGAGATIVAKAAAPLYPVEDNRLMIALSLVAVALFGSLMLVMVFRHYVTRQLKEIDQMADEKDLEDLDGEMPAEVKAV